LRRYWLRREISSDPAILSASIARSPLPRRSRACRSSLSELVKGVCGAERSGTARCSSMRCACRAAGDFVGRLERLVDGLLPGGVVQHMVSIPRARRCLPALHLSGRDVCPPGARAYSARWRGSRDPRRTGGGPAVAPLGLTNRLRDRGAQRALAGRDEARRTTEGMPVRSGYEGRALPTDRRQAIAGARSADSPAHPRLKLIAERGRHSGGRRANSRCSGRLFGGWQGCVCCARTAVLCAGDQGQAAAGPLVLGDGASVRAGR